MTRDELADKIAAPVDEKQRKTLKRAARHSCYSLAFFLFGLCLIAYLEAQAPQSYPAEEKKFFSYFSIYVLGCFGVTMSIYLHHANIWKRRDTFLSHFKVEDLQNARDCEVELCLVSYESEDHLSRQHGPAYKVVGLDKAYVVINGPKKRKASGKLLNYEGSYYFFDEELLLELLPGEDKAAA